MREVVPVLLMFLFAVCGIAIASSITPITEQPIGAFSGGGGLGQGNMRGSFTPNGYFLIYLSDASGSSTASVSFTPKGTRDAWEGLTRALCEAEEAGATFQQGPMPPWACGPATVVEECTVNPFSGVCE